MSALGQVDWQNYDFIDLGCSSGGSIEHCMMRFSAERGLGVDVDGRKVEKTRVAGFDAIETDARELNLDGQVSFVSMLDFCEHLPDLSVVEEIIAAATNSARDFLYIKHPSFEGEQLVESQGLRQYWWDWHGHTCHVRLSDYCSMFDRLGLATYMVRYIGRVDDSSHPCIVPTSTAMDQSEADAVAITDNPELDFSPPLWRRQDIFVALRAFDPQEWLEITRPTPQDLKVMRSTGQLPESGEIPVHMQASPRPSQPTAAP